MTAGKDPQKLIAIGLGSGAIETERHQGACVLSPLFALVGMDDIAECRKALLRDLQREAELLEGLRFAMYEYAVWTGYLNKLDEISPHCVQTTAEAHFWHSVALNYLAGFKHGYQAGRT